MTSESNDLLEVKEIFFAAMWSGWASGNDGTPIKAFRNWRQTRTRHAFDRTFIAVDRWGMDMEANKPTGSTLITHGGVPVWVMWYGGDSYNKDVLRFLREALMENYRNKVFCVGRGPAEYRKDNLLYTNECKGDFMRFSGHEYIEYLRDNGEKQNAGSHRYWGGSLFYLA